MSLQLNCAFSSHSSFPLDRRGFGFRADTINRKEPIPMNWITQSACSTVPSLLRRTYWCTVHHSVSSIIAATSTRHRFNCSGLRLRPWPFIFVHIMVVVAIPIGTASPPLARIFDHLFLCSHWLRGSCFFQLSFFLFLFGSMVHFVLCLYHIHTGLKGEGFRGG
jgi:hypothetical protein